MNANTMNDTSKTDWERIDAMGDEDIDTSDIPPLSAEFWAKAKLRSPRQITASVQIDPETFAWFQSQGENATQQMSVALKIYAEAHKSYVTTAKA
ncbi:BrnA antitoxin family protein [Pseudanabaena biceps]|nr:BrnA antitoxin family protein [Pseudanabaena biceps]